MCRREYRQCWECERERESEKELKIVRRREYRQCCESVCVRERERVKRR